jgi:hypothetical protein
MPAHRPAKERFWEKVRVSDDVDACWDWTGSAGNSGYGTFFGDDKRFWGAHRWAWFDSNGEIPDGMFVCHSCDNKLCCNPGHLFLGTHQDNMDDMCSKDRGGRAKVTNIQARNIRQRYELGLGTQAALAREYHVTQASIWKIVQGGTHRAR